MSRRSARLNPTRSPDTSLKNEQPDTSSTSTNPFTIIQTTTSLSEIPSSDKDTLTLLVHSTNAFGTWGAGFAKAVRTRYPSAELVYKSWCDELRPTSSIWPSKDLVGRCLVVEPQDEDQNGESGDGVAIACLFTSYGYGGKAVKGVKNGGHAAKDGPKKVIESTKTALEEMRGWIKEVEEGDRDKAEDVEEAVGVKGTNTQEGRKRKVVVYSPKFNSGNFGVDWEITADMIREAFVDWEGEWRILSAQ